MRFGQHSLLGKQTRVENISLITDPGCGIFDTQLYMDLAGFTKLQSLTWRGLSRFEDFESVRKCIMTNGERMKSLTLDLINWTNSRTAWMLGFRQRVEHHPKRPDNFFASALVIFTMIL